MPMTGRADDFYIEDDELAALPTPIEAAIRKSKDFDSTSCKLIGKTIDLTGKQPHSGYFVTTADACDWGRALGPIWVVRSEPNPAVVLAHGGYALKLVQPLNNGLLSISITAETAGKSAKSLWKFDGQHYSKAK